jgi:hypothetical protein
MALVSIEVTSGAADQKTEAIAIPTKSSKGRSLVAK